MPRNLPFSSRPTAYFLTLPGDTSVASNGSNFRTLWWGGVVYQYNDTDKPSLLEEFTSYSFPQGAVATLPTGLQYIKTGDIWLLAPIPVTTPVVLTGQVPSYQEYWVIKQVPYNGRGRAVDPSVIPFNVPMSCAKTGDFPSANEPVFAPAAGAMARGKIGIVVNILVSPSGSGNRNLESSSQVNAPATRGRLAKAIVREVETALDTESSILVAFFNQVFVREFSFDDLFLVELVKVSKSTYQPTIALRVHA